MIELSVGFQFFPVAPSHEKLRAGDPVRLNDRGQLVRVSTVTDTGFLPESAVLGDDGTVSMPAEDYARLMQQIGRGR